MLFSVHLFLQTVLHALVATYFQFIFGFRKVAPLIKSVNEAAPIFADFLEIFISRLGLEDSSDLNMAYLGLGGECQFYDWQRHVGVIDSTDGPEADGSKISEYSEVSF